MGIPNVAPILLITKSCKFDVYASVPKATDKALCMIIANHQ